MFEQDDFRQLSEAIRNGDWNRALDFLSSRWKETLRVAWNVEKPKRGSYVEASLGPFLAECFQPIPQRERSCVLLQAARAYTSGLKDKLRKLQDLQDRTDSFCPAHKARPFQQTLRLRAETIDIARLSGATTQELKKRLARLLADYQNLWKADQWQTLPGCSTELRPAAWRALNDHRPRLAGLIENIVSKIQLRWLDPAAVFLADTLLGCSGGNVAPARDQPDDCGRTWVLIAVDDPWRQQPNPTGLLLLLQVEALPNGCGAFYPHPDHAAHIVVDAAFQQAFCTAWHLVLGNRYGDGTDPRCRDYRWSLTAIDGSNEGDDPHRLRKSLMFCPLEGCSGEVSLTAGLKSAVERIPLDLSRAATAMFAQDPLTNANPVLQTVLSVTQKRIGIEQIPEALIRRLNISRIREIVVASGQTETIDLGGKELKKLPAADFEGAWNLLSHDSVITEKYKQKSLEAARRFFEKHCFGTAEDPTGSYRLNRISRRCELAKVPEDDEKRRLTGDQTASLVTGRIAEALPPESKNGSPARLVKMVADSAIGKTTLLFYCQHEMSRVAGPLVPIRIGHLTTFLARTGKESLLEAAVEEVLAVLGDSPTTETVRFDPETFKDWLERKAEAGEVVWLLDALDQMSAHRERVAAFAKAFRECPVLLTLRPESETEFGEVTTESHVEWRMLDLHPFDEDQAREYLGEYADLFFDRLPLADRRDDPEGHVLTVPLLLFLLKKLARERNLPSDADPKTLNLPEFRNRYAIYSVVLVQRDGLVGKGLGSLQHRESDVRNVFEELADAIDCHKDVAWLQVQRHHFDTTIRGSLYDAIKERLRPRYQGRSITAVKQLDVLSQLPTFDGGLKWRHRSFLEFFAGCRLAELFAEPKTRAEAVDVLRDVHEVLDAEGRLKKWEFRDQADNVVQEFRDLPAAWHWTLRFALAHREGRTRNELALLLIRLGNPWIVYEAIRNDNLEFDVNVKRLCRWLVHRAWRYNDAWNEDSAPLEALQGVFRQVTERQGSHDASSSFLVGLLDRSTRDAAFLDPALELIEQGKQSAEKAFAAACHDVREAYLREVSRLSREVLERFLKRFVPIPEGEFDPGPFHNKKELQEAGVTGPVTIPPGLSMSDCPVTNAFFELFCPTHRRMRDRYSYQDDQPAVYMSFWAAQRFCEWLTGVRDPNAGQISKDGFRLPTEWEWEYACRAGCKSRWCFGDSVAALINYAWYLENSKLQTQQVRTRDANKWGLYDMHGQVLEWCQDSCEGGLPTRETKRFAARSRVLRGGCWESPADQTSASARMNQAPDILNEMIGFRLAKLPLVE